MNFSFSEIEQKQQQVTKGGDDGECIKSYGKSLVEKVDAGQTKVTDQGTTHPYKSRRFIITLPFLMLF